MSAANPSDCAPFRVPGKHLVNEQIHLDVKIHAEQQG